MFSFLDRVLEQDLGFVGTESRLRLVIETLADLVVNASDDPEARLNHLRGEKLRIESEIARIESEGVVTRYQSAQIRERFATAVSLAEQVDGLETIRRMIPMLLAEAEQVMRTNQRLSATLRRLLDVRVYRDRQHVAGLLREIKVLAASLALNPPEDTVGLEIETKAAIASPFHRTFWSEPAQFTQVDLTEHEVDEDRRTEAFRALAMMQRLDWGCYTYPFR